MERGREREIELNGCFSITKFVVVVNGVSVMAFDSVHRPMLVV